MRKTMLVKAIVLCITEVLKKLRDSGKTILIASHNQTDIDELCDTRCEMDAGILTQLHCKNAIDES